MKTLVKICGLSTAESVIAARDNGASYLGFIFFEKSPRHVSPQTAGELVKQAGDCQTVAVTVKADDAYLDAITALMKPTMLQLHGNESAERLLEVKARYELPIIKAMSVRSADDLTTAAGYANVADMLLLDAKPPENSELPGGNGVSFDWSLVANLKSTVPALLSGGIDLTNIAEAVSLVGNASNDLVGLDLSSGVESAPGVKDISKISALLNICKAATARE